MTQELVLISAVRNISQYRDRNVQVTLDIMGECVELAIDIQKRIDKGLGIQNEYDFEKILKQIKSNESFDTGESEILDDIDDEHDLEWVGKKIDDGFEFPRWQRYKTHVLQEKIKSNPIISSIDRESNKILTRLTDPEKEGPWDRKGMVVGDVQAGKTGNYIALINKAVDAGYKYIIVLGGQTNDLRSQTQTRIDEGFLGYDTEAHRSYEEDISPKIGVGIGNTTQFEKLWAQSGTSSLKNGDFTRSFIDNFYPVPKKPIIWVVKKNVTPLRNLYTWLRGQDNLNTPLLLIDDECDYASIDTSNDEQNPTSINQLIRLILNKYKRTAYVGYTATPYANIFIDLETDETETQSVLKKAGEIIHKDDTLGKDLFPRNFILTLPTAPNYIGPEKLFGISDFEDKETTGVIPLTINIPDHETWIPPKHNKRTPRLPLPESLKQAIKSFILATAARTLRKQYDHNTMLIHVTRLNDVQKWISEYVEDEINLYKNRFQTGNKIQIERLNDQFRSLWENDFIAKRKSIIELSGDDEASEHNQEWKEIQDQLYNVLKTIKVQMFNGNEKDALQYNNARRKKDKQYLNIIAVGGEKLSRGLTLEGLTTCYFLRQSKMYDTLMQMGRWFGYRNGYIDLCRLYSNRTLIKNFEHISNVTFELKKDFEQMVETGHTPMDFTLRVRTHPGALLISGYGKLRNGTEIKMTWAGKLYSTTLFDKNNVQNSQAILNKFLSRHESNKTLSKDGVIWKNIGGIDIADFIESISQNEFITRRTSEHQISKYIESQVNKNELLDWTVYLPTLKDVSDVGIIANIKTAIHQRSNTRDSSDDYYRIGTLMSLQDELIDFSEEEKNKAENLTAELNRENRKLNLGKKEIKSLSRFVKQIRDPRKGLMIIYPIKPERDSDAEYYVSYVLSFPTSDTAREGLTYMKPNWQSNLEDQLEQGELGL